MLKEKILENLKEAVKKKEMPKITALRFLLSILQNQEIEKKTKLRNEGLAVEEIEKKGKLSDEEVASTISSEIKKRSEAVAEFRKGGRDNLAAKEESEIAILKNYLPRQMTEDEIRRLAQEIIEEVGAKELKDMGKVMSRLMPKTKNKADGRLVLEIVKKLLSD